MDELDNILNDSPEHPTEDVEQKEKLESEEKEADSKLDVEDQENENSSDRQVDDDAQVPQEDEDQEADKKDEDDEEEAPNAKDDDDQEEASEGETKKEKRKRKKKEKKSKKDKKDKRRKKKKEDEDENLKSKIFGDSEDEDEDNKGKDADFDAEDVDIEEEGKRALEEIVEKKKEKKKKRSRDDKKKSRSSKKRKSEDENNAAPEQVHPPSNEPNDFDLVIESLKKGHRRRRSEGPPEGSDEFVRTFVHKMDAAAEEDIRANQQHLPALNKVRILPEVSSQLAKKFLHEIFVSAGVLNALKKWLDPLPDGSLPNIKVREVVLRGLSDMGNHVQTEDLRESGIGKTIMVLSKHPEETPANKKTAKTLIELWSRPIFNLSSKYKDMHKAEDRFPVAESDGQVQVKSVKTVSTELEHSTSGSPTTKGNKDSPSLHAKIPDKIALDFKVMPKANEEAARLLSAPKRGDAKGMGRKSPSANKNKIDRAVVMSIEGRGVYR